MSRVLRVGALWCAWCVLQVVALGGLIVGCLPLLPVYILLGLAWLPLKLTQLAEAEADRVQQAIDTAQGGHP